MKPDKTPAKYQLKNLRVDKIDLVGRPANGEPTMAIAKAQFLVDDGSGGLRQLTEQEDQARLLGSAIAQVVAKAITVGKRGADAAYAMMWPIMEGLDRLYGLLCNMPTTAGEGMLDEVIATELGMIAEQIMQLANAFGTGTPVAMSAPDITAPDQVEAVYQDVAKAGAKMSAKRKAAVKGAIKQLLSVLAEADGVDVGEVAQSFVGDTKKSADTDGVDAVLAELAGQVNRLATRVEEVAAARVAKSAPDVDVAKVVAAEVKKQVDARLAPGSGAPPDTAGAGGVVIGHAPSRGAA